MLFTVEAKDQGKRLDKFLTEYLSSWSRSEVQKFISQSEVTVNGRIASSGYKIKPEDKVETGSLTQLHQEEEEERERQKRIFSRIEIVEDAPAYAVLDKPAGLITHRAPHIKEVSLVDFLREKYPEIDQVGEDEWRPGLVHRLDREVSGLLAVTKTNDFFQKLKIQFRDREVEKWYTALVHGAVDKDEDVIDLPIKRSNKGFRMAAVPPTSLDRGKSREARTYWYVEKRWRNFSLLRVKIETGRTHQIRTHLFAYGHPVVGDKIYTNKRIRKLNQKVWNQGFPEDRIFLVASYLKFLGPDGAPREFSVDLPLNLQEFLDKLEN